MTTVVAQHPRLVMQNLPMSSSSSVHPSCSVSNGIQHPDMCSRPVKPLKGKTAERHARVGGKPFDKPQAGDLAVEPPKGTRFASLPDKKYAYVPSQPSAPLLSTEFVDVSAFASGFGNWVDDSGSDTDSEIDVADYASTEVETVLSLSVPSSPVSSDCYSERFGRKRGLDSPWTDRRTKQARVNDNDSFLVHLFTSDVSDDMSTSSGADISELSKPDHVKCGENSPDALSQLPRVFDFPFVNPLPLEIPPPASSNSLAVSLHNRMGSKEEDSLFDLGIAPFASDLPLGEVFEDHF
eukprot:Rmarinus@m.3953